MSDNTFTMDKLLAAMRQIEHIPPPPLFVSSKHLPADNALTFKHKGRDYAGAHPDFWRRLKDGLRMWTRVQLIPARQCLRGRGFPGLRGWCMGFGLRGE